jgi:hypothetical protein
MKLPAVFIAIGLIACSALAPFRPSPTMQRYSMNAQEREICGNQARGLDAAEDDGDQGKIGAAKWGVDQCMAALEPYIHRDRMWARAEKLRQEDAAASAEKTRAAYAADKFNERIGLSAVVCAFSYLRRHAVEEIATERKYAAEGGGIVDMKKLHDLQNQMRLADESLARLGARAADPLPCEGEVLNVANCVLSARLTGEIPGAPACNSKTSLWAYEQ